VQTYLSLSDSESYLKDHMVQDPIALVRFPSFAAGATLEWNGQKYYFLAEETRREFAELNKIAIG
jgi:YHS domain-containing protein